MSVSEPNKKNFCGGNFQDWLEVNLTEICNGRCAWCVEKNGWHPKYHADWLTIAEQALRSNKTNIILLGGEPTLHKDLSKIIKALSKNLRKVWITTNGSRLTPEFVKDNLNGIAGINISIHHWSMSKNERITGIYLENQQLVLSINALHEIGASVRFNCNCISGYVDSIGGIASYIGFAKKCGADKIRFAELKDNDEGFVDLAKLLNYKYGLNDNPFIHGCNSDAVIDGMPVDFRQMCGLQTSRRTKPENPVQYAKEVLYYDGKFYKGWQTQRKENIMTDKELGELLQDVANGTVSVVEAALKIRKEEKNETCSRFL